MESISKFVSSWSYSQESAASRTMSVYGNLYLAAGLLLGYLLLGLIIFIVAFWFQRSKLRVFWDSVIFILACQKSSLKGVQNIHDGLFYVFLMDIINGVTAVVYAVYLISNNCYYACNIVSIVWFLSRSVGIVFHLLCALMSVLHLCHPHLKVQLRSIATVVCLLTAVFIPLYYYYYLVGLIGFAVITFGLALAIIAKSFGSTASPSAAAYKRWIVFFAMITFFVVYLPAFVLDCLRISSTDFIEVQNYEIIYTNLLYCTNIQLVLDGFLCLLILRLPAEEKEEEKPPQYGIEIPRVNTFQNPYFK